LSFADAPRSPWEAIHAPLPRSAPGHASRVGDEKTMRFGKGVVRVRVVAIEPHRLVAEVVEQVFVFNQIIRHRRSPP
jgi:hypothetical protein